MIAKALKHDGQKIRATKNGAHRAGARRFWRP
jgi:hypothetical protein